MKRAWQYWIAEPFAWIGSCCFQSTRFTREFEAKGFSRNILLSLRLSLPVLLISYPLTLAIRLALSLAFYGSIPGLDHLLLGTLAASFVGVVSGMFVGLAGGLTGSIALGLAWGIAGDIFFTAAAGIPNFISLSVAENSRALGAITTASGIVEVIVVGIIFGMTLGVRMGLVGFLSTLLIGIMLGLLHMLTGSIAVGVFLCFILVVSYILGYNQVLSYPVYVAALWKTYVDSKKNPSLVFTHLQHSALYWNQCAFPPFLGLKAALLIAVGQDPERTLEEVAFIDAERPRYRSVMQSIVLEIAIHDLERRRDMHDIAHAWEYMDKVLWQGIGLLDPLWSTPFVRLKDASQEAARYCDAENRRDRQKALDEMIGNLKKVHIPPALRSLEISTRVEKVVDHWLREARQEQDEQEQAPQEIGQIDNPFVAGPLLKAGDSRFVGRKDLVEQLRGALDREDGRPAFLLYGERRIGKSSTLSQLPIVLGTHYLPVIYDLQSRDISSSVAAFLSTLAHEISRVVSRRGASLKPVSEKRLERARQRNEAAVYRIFNLWFKEVEDTLERDDRTLLLIFDEFEKLEAARQKGYLDLTLLLDWFRNLIQHHSRVALLFSGLKTFSEMDAAWVGYFVNVQTLKVSFLQPSEAHKLITQPKPNFPSEQVFGEEVVAEIMRITGCHPFMVQAVCANLIDHLNAQHRQRVVIDDIPIAVDRMFELWASHFQDLWDRTGQKDRVCLSIMKERGEVDSLSIEQQSGFDRQTVRQTLQALLKRDLIRVANDRYRIAAAIFGEWIERSNSCESILDSEYL
ncbi:MAG: AAA family ATPase [Ktedonobacteraceae bacterium]